MVQLRAKLHVVMNNNATTAHHLFIARRFLFKIISISPDHCVGMNFHMVADNSMIIYRNIGMNNAVAAYFHVIADKNSRLNDRVFANRSRFSITYLLLALGTKGRNLVTILT